MYKCHHYKFKFAVVALIKSLINYVKTFNRSCCSELKIVYVKCAFFVALQQKKGKTSTASQSFWTSRCASKHGLYAQRAHWIKCGKMLKPVLRHSCGSKGWRYFEQKHNGCGWMRFNGTHAHTHDSTRTRSNASERETTLFLSLMHYIVYVLIAEGH